jgi:hypothetical protein
MRAPMSGVIVPGDEAGDCGIEACHGANDQ